MADGGRKTIVLYWRKEERTFWLNMGKAGKG